MPNLVNLCESSENYEKIRDLINRGENVNSTHYGTTPLCVACYHNHTKIVKLLLEQVKIDPNLMSREAYPLVFAIDNENVEIIKLFLNHPKTSINIFNHNFSTPLMEALELLRLPNENGESDSETKKRRYEIIDLLLKHPDINLYGDDEERYNTPINFIQYSKDFELRMKFLSHPRIGKNNAWEYISDYFIHESEIIKRILINSADSDIERIQYKYKSMEGHPVCQYFEDHPVCQYFEDKSIIDRWKIELDYPAYLFSLVLFYSDCKVKTGNNNLDKYFNILYKLPIELKMVTCNLVYFSKKLFINEDHFKYHFKNFQQ